MIGRFYRDGIAYTLPRIFTQGLNILLLPLYTRALSAKDYGSLDLFLVFVGLVQIIVTLEIQQALARFYGPDNEHKERRNYAFTAFAFMLAAYSGLTLLALMFENRLSTLILQQEGMLTAYRLAIGYIWFNGVLQFLLTLLRADLRSREYSTILLINGSLTAIIGVLLVVVMSMGLNGMLTAMFVSTAVCACILGIRTRISVRGRFKQEKLREMLAFSTPLVFSSLAFISCLYIDRLMLQYFLGLESVGAYGVAYRIAAVAGLSIVGFQGALMPLIYKNHDSQETPGQLARLFRQFAGGALAILLVSQTFAAEALVLLADPKFHMAESCLTLLLPAVILSRIYIFAPGLSLKKKSATITLINVAGAVSNIVLNAVFIPLLGLSGAALASLLSLVFVFVLLMYYSQKLYPVPHQWNNILTGCLTVGIIHCCRQLAEFSLPPETHLITKFLLLGIGCLVLIRLGLIKFPRK